MGRSSRSLQHVDEDGCGYSGRRKNLTAFFNCTESSAPNNWRHNNAHATCNHWCSKVHGKAELLLRPQVRCWSASSSTLESCKCAGQRLAIFLQGESFRVGSIHSRRTDGNLDEQVDAFASVKRHVVLPALRSGWCSVSIFASIIAKNQTVAEAGLCGRDAQIADGVAALRVQQALRFPHDQMDSLRERLAWFIDAASCFPPWDSVLILRPDLIFRRPITFAPAGGDLMVPFRNSDGRLPNWRSSTSLLNPRVADTMLLVPRNRFNEVACLVATIPRKFRTGLLHYMCDYVGGVRYFWTASRHDSNSALEWNPLYRIAGRPEALPNVTQVTP